MYFFAYEINIFFLLLLIRLMKDISLLWTKLRSLILGWSKISNLTSRPKALVVIARFSMIKE
jgi:hypothetical protein